MRLSPLIPVVVSTLLASTLGAQERMPLDAPHQPLPVVLLPEQRSADAAEAWRAADALEQGLLTGMVVGVVTGGVYGAAFAKDCGEESDCILSREYKTMILAIMGGALGGLIGAGTGYVLGARNPPRDPAAPLTIAPAASGSVSVGMTLRH